MTIKALARLNETAEPDRTDEAIHNFVQGFPLTLRYIRQAKILDDKNAKIDLFVTAHRETSKINRFLKGKGFKLVGKSDAQGTYTWTKALGDPVEKEFTVQYNSWYGTLIVDAQQNI